MGKSQHRELSNRLKILFAHLLKWELPKQVFSPADFPRTCPYSLDQALDKDFYPGEVL